jgi:CheY-like chemotaxis protein
VGVGTGLGLTISHRIVAALAGTIEVESRVGKGTVFRVLLPSAEPATEPATKAATEATTDATGAAPASDTERPRRGRILLIDDDSLVRGAVVRTLEREHDVVAVEAAAPALARIVAGERFDVILCDVMMPQMSGIQFHAELGRVAPDQLHRVVFVSGGAFTDQARAFLDAVSNPRLEKPVDRATLRRVVNGFVR